MSITQHGSHGFFEEHPEKEKDSERVSGEITGGVYLDVMNIATKIDIGSLGVPEMDVCDLGLFESGIYLPGFIGPRISFNQPLFIFDDFKEKAGIFAMENGKYVDRVLSRKNFQYATQGMEPTITAKELLKGKFVNVYTPQGRVVVSGHQLYMVRNIARSSPWPDQVRCEIALSVLFRHLKQACPHLRCIRSMSSLEGLLKEDFHHLIEKQHFEVCLDAELLTLDRFIQGHEHFIYFFKVKNKTLQIYRTCDWRVFRYYEMMEEEEEKKSN